MMRIILLTLVLLLFAGIAESRQNDSETIIYSSFNECVKTLKPEWEDNGLWFQLRESLLANPPRYTKSLDREALVDELIALHEKRLQLLRRMKKAEGR